MSQKVAELIARLSKYYWSHDHPRSYVLFIDGKYRGIGAVAHQNYGAFNLAWLSVLGDLSTVDKHHAALKTFELAKSLETSEISGVSVCSYATLLRPPEFFKLFSAQNTLASNFSNSSKMLLLNSISSYESLQKLQRVQ